MRVKETLVNIGTGFDQEVHPVARPIVIWPPVILRHLFSGRSVDFYTTVDRDLSPLITGVIAINIVVAKAKGTGYPTGLIEPSLWNRHLIKQAKKYLFTETGYEASLRSLDPEAFIYVRYTDESPHGVPVLRIHRVHTTTDNDIGCIVHGKRMRKGMSVLHLRKQEH